MWKVRLLLGWLALRLEGVIVRGERVVLAVALIPRRCSHEELALVGIGHLLRHQILLRILALKLLLLSSRSFPEGVISERLSSLSRWLAHILLRRSSESKRIA